jgi:hypothetical protein
VTSVGTRLATKLSNHGTGQRMAPLILIQAAA